MAGATVHTTNEQEFWEKFEEIIERAIKRARSQEIKEVAEAIKMLSDYMKTGFEKTFQALLEHSKIIEDHSKRLEELARRVEDHSKRLEELTLTVTNLTKAVLEVKIAVGSFTGRVGLDLEKTIFNLYRDLLLNLGIENIDRIDKFIYRDVDGRYIGKGGRIEVDIYIHNNNIYLIEVKSLAQEEDIDWISKKFDIVAQILNRTPTRKIIIAVNITRGALERARELNMDVIYGSVID